ncbi:hypothetical protein FHS78_000398 [Parvibaculum indicum]|uniref:hypothetical protein n=1 Tax=Parvibaculum indicum TaxID=562969 RepID=UPI00141D82B6|nr:hypothetical protein [Parvibaculum indicum]NIJ40143.1 hypothetical protein [Parvibaculum indicum]
MAKLTYSRDELMASHEAARPHEAAGYLLHGGIAADGSYLSPRTLHRWPAVHAWQEQLTKSGWPLIDASVQLLKRGNYPSIEQQRLLLKNGYGESLWNSLTITGIIEARGRALCDLQAPDFQQIIADDISQTCAGHLHKGLLYAHGADEGGDPDHPEYGAHDAMWFAARDLLFGADAYPIPEVPESIGRPDQGRLMPQLPEGFEQLILLLMNVLMIEVRAESFFSFCCEIMRDPELFTDRRADAEMAAEMVERIRVDEAIHVGYLQTTISEMRSFTFKAVDGGTVKGKDLIDPIWEGMVEWHAVTQADFSRQQTHDAIGARLEATPEGRKLFAEFEALETKARAA